MMTIAEIEVHQERQILLFCSCDYSVIYPVLPLFATERWSYCIYQMLPNNR